MLAQNIMQYDHILKNVDFIQAYVTPAVGHFCPRGIILIHLVEVMLHTKYQGSKPCGFRKEIFFKFSLLKPV